MSTFTNPLDNVRIASPCSVDWNAMYGNEQNRFCGDCKLNVYNLSGMTKQEAETLIMNAEGRLCVRFYRRADGSVITKDCPIGWAGVKHRARIFSTAAASMLMAILTGVFFVSLFSTKNVTVGKLKIPLTRPTPEPKPLMGAIPLPQREDPPKPKRTMNEIQGEIDAPVVKRTS